ncbi:MAG: TIM44-like domain-containing protein [Alphaproteobacteria bacterium]|nr:MAG: TIM44-like domain-containing protein [Alphaproteobacteria bacterium]
MLYLFIVFCTLYLIVAYADKLPKKPASKTPSTPEDLVESINKQKDDLKQEFLTFFKEIYSCFSTGTLQTIAPKVNNDILESLKASIKERDSTNFTHSFKNEPSCEIRDIEVKQDESGNIVSIKAEFQSEQVISGPEMEEFTDNVVDFFVFEKRLSEKNKNLKRTGDWKLVKMG